MSPPYNRSREFHSKCLRFRYMLRGPGEKTMTIYQKTSSYREIPIWISKMNTGQNWIYGQVPLSSVSKFQVIILIDVRIISTLIIATPTHTHQWMIPSLCQEPSQTHFKENTVPGTLCQLRTFTKLSIIHQFIQCSEGTWILISIDVFMILPLCRLLNCCFDWEDISNTRDSVSSDFQTRTFHPKYSAKRRIFNSLLGVWKSDETLPSCLIYYLFYSTIVFFI